MIPNHYDPATAGELFLEDPARRYGVPRSECLENRLTPVSRRAFLRVCGYRVAS
jgi:hypothetical protein